MDRRLMFFSSCDMGEYLVVIDEIARCLFEVEKKSGRSKCLVELEAWKPGKNICYQCAEKYNDKIFFFPFIINYAPIIVYYFKEQKVEYINLQEKSNLVNGNYQFVQRVDDSVWIFPVSLEKGLLIFHMDNASVEVIETWSPVMKNIKLDAVNNCSKVGTMVENEGHLYQTIIETNMIIEIAKDNYDIKIHTLPDEIKLYRSMDYDGCNFWIPDIQGNVVMWAPQEGVKNFFNIFDDTTKKRKRNAKTVVCGKNHVWLLPYQQDHRIIQMEYQTGTYRFIDIFPDKFIYNPENTGRMFGQMHQNGSVLDIYPINGNLVIHIDLEKDCLLEQHEIITLPEEWSDEYILQYELQSQREVNRISPSCNMDAFIQTVYNEKMIKSDHMHGQKIWECLTRQA